MKYLLHILPFIVLIAPMVVFGQEPRGYQPLVGIPGVGTDGQYDGNFDQYLQAIYATSISLAALLAVIKIVIAGVKWMTTDIVEGKSSAKKDIEGAILGLVVILSAVLILYIINPNIGAVSLNLQQAPQPAPRANEATLTRLEQCNQPGNDTCRQMTCTPESFGAGGIRDGGTGASTATFDCQAREDECLGTFEYVGQGRGTCTATEAETTARLAEIAAANCTDGRECNATVCDARNLGLFEDCSEQCEARNGINYNSDSNTCVAYSDSYDTTGDVVVEGDTTYTIRQNEDDLAAGDDPVEISILSDTAENGFVTVEYADGTQRELACGAIVPNPCSQ